MPWNGPWALLTRGGVFVAAGCTRGGILGPIGKGHGDGVGQLEFTAGPRPLLVALRSLSRPTQARGVISGPLGWVGADLPFWQPGVWAGTLCPPSRGWGCHAGCLEPGFLPSRHWVGSPSQLAAMESKTRGPTGMECLPNWLAGQIQYKDSGPSRWGARTLFMSATAPNPKPPSKWWGHYTSWPKRGWNAKLCWWRQGFCAANRSQG